MRYIRHGLLFFTAFGLVLVQQHFAAADERTVHHVTLLGNHAGYLTPTPDGTARSDSRIVGEREIWRIIDLDGGDLLAGDTVALQASNSHYLSTGIQGEVSAYIGIVQDLEQWTIEMAEGDAGKPIGNGTMVSLLSHRGTYLVAEQDGAAKADRSEAFAWERWIIEFRD